MGRADLKGDAVVIGGGLVGAETAEHIAVHNHRTTIVEMLPEIAAEMAAAPKDFLMQSLERNHVTLCPDTKVLEITDSAVVVEHNGQKREIPADMVILAIGSRPEKELAEKLGTKIPITVVGDADKVGKALDGIDAAYRAALKL